MLECIGTLFETIDKSIVIGSTSMSWLRLTNEKQRGHKESKPGNSEEVDMTTSTNSR
jgi:hypothetical protein